MQPLAPTESFPRPAVYPEDASDAAAVVEQADKAMYDDKSARRVAAR
jgi:GGDEF domain-containing protein